jgi:hypothetical protein
MDVSEQPAGSALIIDGSSTQNMGAAESSETSVSIHQTSRHHKPEHLHCTSHNSSFPLAFTPVDVKLPVPHIAHWQGSALPSSGLQCTLSNRMQMYCGESLFKSFLSLGHSVWILLFGTRYPSTAFVYQCYNGSLNFQLQDSIFGLAQSYDYR